MKLYKPELTASVNGKGVLDVDTVKGCSLGMAAHPGGGCYGECYAAKTAHRFGIDFTTSVCREIKSTSAYRAVQRHAAPWYRIGVAGDPSHNWDHTLDVCEMLKDTGKTAVIITKHWKTMTAIDLDCFVALGAVFNTSTSALDSEQEIGHRLAQYRRIVEAGGNSWLRVVTCDFADTAWGNSRRNLQNILLSNSNVIDNPLRVTSKNALVKSGQIKKTKRSDAIGGSKLISLHDDSVYLGSCAGCPDQCGYKPRSKK